MRPIRVYSDTSVFGGVFDSEFEFVSKAFFQQVEWGRFDLVSSVLVRDELREAPSYVREFFIDRVELLEVSEIVVEALDLQLAYLKARNVGESSLADALHVALAIVLDCRIIVSWNLKHIVIFRRFRCTMQQTRRTVIPKMPFTPRRRWSPMKKTFDCVEMKRKGSQKIYEALKGKNRDEQAAYWKERNEETRNAWTREKKSSQSPSTTTESSQ